MLSKIISAVILVNTHHPHSHFFLLLKWQFKENGMVSKASGLETKEKARGLLSQVQKMTTWKSRLIPPSFSFLLWKTLMCDVVEKSRQWKEGEMWRSHRTLFKSTSSHYYLLFFSWKLLKHSTQFPHFDRSLTTKAALWWEVDELGGLQVRRLKNWAGDGGKAGEEGSQAWGSGVTEKERLETLICLERLCSVLEDCLWSDFPWYGDLSQGTRFLWNHLFQAG